MIRDRLYLVNKDRLAYWSAESRVRLFRREAPMAQMYKPPEVYERTMGKTAFDEKYIKTGRARWVRDRDGRTRRMPDFEVDRLIAEDFAATYAEPATPPQPALSHDATMKGACSRRKHQKTTSRKTRKVPPPASKPRGRKRAEA